MNKRTVTLSEAAQILGVHRNTIRNWIMDGKLPSAEKQQTEDSIERWTIDEDEILNVRRTRPRAKTDTASLSETVWVIHDLATRLADAEARAARAEAKLEEFAKRESKPGNEGKDGQHQ